MRVNWNFIYRKKKFDSIKLEQTQLSRVLNLFDLTTLGNIILEKMIKE